MPVCLAVPACACPRRCCRRPRRYPSDTTDAEWALIGPLLPVPACQTRAGGHPEEHSRRVVVDAIRYVIHNGCVWRALPADFPPWRTIYGLYQRWTPPVPPSPCTTRYARRSAWPPGARLNRPPR